MSVAVKWNPRLTKLADDLLNGKSTECWLCEPETGTTAKDVAKHLRMVEESKMRWIKHLCHEHKVELSAELMKLEGTR